MDDAWPASMRSGALLARANDFICRLDAPEKGDKTQSELGGDSQPMMMSLAAHRGRRRSCSMAGDPEKLRRLSQMLSLPLDVTEKAYDIFSRHASPPSARSDTLQAARLSRDQYIKAICEFLDCDVEDIPSGCVQEAFQWADKDESSDIDFTEFAMWICSRSFAEVLNVSAEQIEMRELARKHSLPYTDVEQYKASFDDFDSDRSGAIDRGEFEVLLNKCAGVPKGERFPQQRVQALWRVADLDGSGGIEFEEFLVFYKRYFDGSGFESMYRMGSWVPNMRGR